MKLNVENNYIDMSPSQLMVRNDWHKLQTVRSNFPIKSRTFYFEATIITDGQLIIGLTASDDNHSTVGGDSLSIGLDGFKQCVWMNGWPFPFKDHHHSLAWTVGDVIGVYFDSDVRRVMFSINRQLIELAEDPFLSESDMQKQPSGTNDTNKDCHFSLDGFSLFDPFSLFVLPCHVAVSLGMLQQCYFHFDKHLTVPDEFAQALAFERNRKPKRVRGPGVSFVTQPDGRIKPKSMQILPPPVTPE
ncbi:RING finger and SPRY domain-containing protein 1, partial [Tyrophagus putrescentiae]